jgi:hypothetical protein
MTEPRGRYSPIDPVAYGAPIVCPNATTGVLSAICGVNSELMRDVASLWITPQDKVVDVTFGNGSFWSLLPNLAVLGTDLESGVDCRALPYEDESIDVLAFDPPYQPTHGKPGRSYGVGDSYRTGACGLQTISDVLALYRDGLLEAARVVRSGGRILVKCQDMTYNHRLHLISLDVLRLMIAAKFDLVDHFILVNRSRMPRRTDRQQRAWRSHSNLYVGVRL